MCEVCNGKSIGQVVEETKLDVARYGWSVTVVEGDRTSPSFGYTIGMTEKRHPEFLVTGRDTRETYNMLSELAAMVLCHEHELKPGTILEPPGRRIFLATVNCPQNILLMASRIYSWRVRALQAIWADDEGRFPWEQSPPDDLTQPLHATLPG
ncbi:DUF4262 domain-containing protein [Arthrobacter pigmenti]